jgi:N,N-dimethylformamidase
MDRIDPGRLDLAREFKRSPLGPHGQDLQKVLKILRWDPSHARFIAVQIESGGPFYLARTRGPKGTSLDVWREPAFATSAEAQWAVFRARWKEHTGVPLELDEDDRPLAAIDPVASEGLVRKPLLGYADRFSVANGERIEFKVSASDGPYRAGVVRLRCADHANIALRTTPLQTSIDGDYRGRMQAICAGSFVEIGEDPAFHVDTFTLQVLVWPTLPGGGEQALAGCWNDGEGSGYGLFLDEAGALALRLGDGAGRQSLSTGVPLLVRHWYLATASVDAAAGSIRICQTPMVRYPRADTFAVTEAPLGRRPSPGGPFRIAACTIAGGREDLPARAGACFNGKLEAPRVAASSLSEEAWQRLVRGDEVWSGDRLLAAWDFSLDISTARITDVSGNARHGRAINVPTRAMKGRHWDGSAYNWREKPAHYAAIHFHDDDLHDCGWKTDFALDVPEELPSGLYCAHLACEGGEDWIPFVVRPPEGEKRADLALLLPTASYWAYANRHAVIDFEGREQVRGAFTEADATGLYLHHHPELGLSTYDNHRDGSGVCYSSRLRPVLSLRPKEKLWQLPADTHIIDWLEAQRITYDVITEDDLDAEGYALLAPYRCVMTGTHPEYPSLAMMEAFDRFKASGGRFVYLGGNGFYWRVSYSPEYPGMMEMRRGEDGIRAWLAEGGEYYHAFTGELGGMWRRMGRAPQSVAGTGMTAQGFDLSTYYERTDASFDPRARFIFAGVGERERIGDFGILGGGAAGWEIDRADVSLGTPPHALVVATATGFTATYHWMKEELTHTHDAITGETCPHVHCDMVFYETLNGGAVFSTSSIAWAGALAHQDYDNNVSRITRNVIERFLDPEPL